MDVPVEDRTGEAGRRVVVGVDGSAGSRMALIHALTMAAGRAAELEVVSAFPIPLYWSGDYPVDVPDSDTVRTETEARIRAFVADVWRDPGLAQVAAADAVPIRVVVAAGPAAPALIARSENAEVLVVGSRGRGAVRSALLGSVALHCITHARRPVVVVHPRKVAPARPPTVVVGVDGSHESRVALVAGIEEARRLGAEVEVVTAYEVTRYWVDVYPAATPTVDEIRAEARRRADALVSEALGALAAVQVTAVPTIRRVVEEGAAAEILVDRAREAELVVVGSRGRGAFRSLVLGSVALRTAVHAPCPVMVVHSDPIRRVDEAVGGGGAGEHSPALVDG